MPFTPSEPGADHGLSIPHEDWERTPSSVRTLVWRQQETITELLKRIEELEARIGRNFQNSNRPPSSDAPHQRIKRKKSKDKKKPGAKKGPPRTPAGFIGADAKGARATRGLFVRFGIMCATCGATVKASGPEGSTTAYGAHHRVLPRLWMMVNHDVAFFRPQSEPQ